MIWRATCGVDGSAWKVEQDENPAPNGSFCPDCRERGSMAPGVLNWKADPAAPDVGEKTSYRAFQLAGPFDARNGAGMWAIDTTTPPIRPVARCLSKDDAEHIVSALASSAAETARLREERDAAEAKWAALKDDRRMWPLETRDAVNALEEAHDISVCSSQHLSEWVDRCETFKARAEAAEAEKEAMRVERDEWKERALDRGVVGANWMDRAIAAEARLASLSLKEGKDE